jgi:hypothetical protein
MNMIHFSVPDSAKFEYGILKVLVKLYAFISHYRRLLHIFKGFSSPAFSADPSKVKSKITKFIDFLYIFFVLRMLPSNYHLFCFDTKNRKEYKKYIGSTATDPYAAINFRILWGSDTILLYDKLFFNVICKHHDLPVSTQYGIFGNDMHSCQPSDIQRLMVRNNLNSVVLKPRYGAYGAGIHFISRDQLRNLKGTQPWDAGEYVIEERIKQHSEMDKINHHSVNSIRIITFLCLDGSVELLGAMLRTSSSVLPVDNFTLGGMVIGIDIKTGKLKRDGFVKNFLNFKSNGIDAPSSLKSIKDRIDTMKKMNLVKPGRIFESHPITKTEFNNFQIPYWDETLEMILKAQKVFHHIKSIGWDIAIRSEGPVIIEGNHLWGTAGIQAANGGLLTEKNRKLLLQYGISFYE